VSRQIDVLASLRILKISLPEGEKIRAGVKESLKYTRETVHRFNITQDDIDAEIHAVLNKEVMKRMVIE